MSAISTQTKSATTTSKSQGMRPVERDTLYRPGTGPHRKAVGAARIGVPDVMAEGAAVETAVATAVIIRPWLALAAVEVSSVRTVALREQCLNGGGDSF